MQPSLEKLRKFFRLEYDNGYQDRAVIGGFVKILDLWQAEARNESVPEEILQAVAACLRGYHDLTPEARAEALKTLWKQIQGQTATRRESQPDASPASSPGWRSASCETHERFMTRIHVDRYVPGVPVPHPADEDSTSIIARIQQEAP